jgi:hypothetical protein
LYRTAAVIFYIEIKRGKLMGGANGNKAISYKSDKPGTIGIVPGHLFRTYFLFL